MHTSDDALQLHALGLSKAKDIFAVDEHLLVCESCRNSLMKMEKEIKALRQALNETELERRQNVALARLRTAGY